MLTDRLIAGLYLGALCVGMADLSHPATISFMHADSVRASASLLSVTAGSIEAQPLSADEASKSRLFCTSWPIFSSHL